MTVKGTTITIDPAVMSSAASTVEAQCAIIDNCIQSIVKDAGSLKSVWEGESASAYQEAITEIEKNSPVVVSILQEYAQDLNEIASSFLSEEQKRKAGNEALPSNVFGVD